MNIFALYTFWNVLGIWSITLDQAYLDFIKRMDFEGNMYTHFQSHLINTFILDQYKQKNVEK